MRKFDDLKIADHRHINSSAHLQISLFTIFIARLYMYKTDKNILRIIIGFIIIYIAALLINLLKHPSLSYISFLNALSGSAVIVYWIKKQLRITQHIYELRELVVLCSECLFVGVSVYILFTGSASGLFKLVQYIIFGIHLAALLLFLIYMLTFKMKKLF